MLWLPKTEEKFRHLSGARFGESILFFCGRNLFCSFPESPNYAKLLLSTHKSIFVVSTKPNGKIKQTKQKITAADFVEWTVFDLAMVTDLKWTRGTDTQMPRNEACARASSHFSWVGYAQPVNVNHKKSCNHQQQNNTSPATWYHWVLSYVFFFCSLPKQIDR